MANRNKNSVYDQNSRYVHGGTTEVVDGFVEHWERREFPKSNTDKAYIIEDIFEGRPDKLAHIIYGNSRYWWILCQYNSILDIDDEFVEGREILIPEKSRIENDFLVGKTGGKPSTRQKISQSKNNT